MKRAVIPMASIVRLPFTTLHPPPGKHSRFQANPSAGHGWLSMFMLLMVPIGSHGSECSLDNGPTACSPLALTANLSYLLAVPSILSGLAKWYERNRKHDCSCFRSRHHLLFESVNLSKESPPYLNASQQGKTLILFEPWLLDRLAG